MGAWRIGELAKRTGLTVRTLHHYDAVGLLRPSARSQAGYRLYDDEDVRRLQRIVALRTLGLSLGEIGRVLDDPTWTAGRLLGLQMERLRERIRQEGELLARLEEIARRLAKANGAGTTLSPEAISAEELLQILEMSVMFEKHYTAEQRAALDRRHEELGPEKIRAVEEEWPILIARVRGCMERGVAADSEEMQPLARRWRELVRMFTGGDPGIAASLSEVYRTEPSVRERTGLDAPVMEYVSRAMAAVGGW